MAELRQLFSDDSDSDVETQHTIEINKDYQRCYEDFRKKEELQRCECLFIGVIGLILQFIVYVLVKNLIICYIFCQYLCSLSLVLW